MYPSTINEYLIYMLFKLRKTILNKIVINNIIFEHLIFDSINMIV